MVKTRSGSGTNSTTPGLALCLTPCLACHLLVSGPLCHVKFVSAGLPTRNLGTVPASFRTAQKSLPRLYVLHMSTSSLKATT